MFVVNPCATFSFCFFSFVRVMFIWAFVCQSRCSATLIPLLLIASFSLLLISLFFLASWDFRLSELSFVSLPSRLFLSHYIFRFFYAVIYVRVYLCIFICYYRHLLIFIYLFLHASDHFLISPSTYLFTVFMQDYPYNFLPLFCI